MRPHHPVPLIGEVKRSEVSPVCPICQRTSACRIWATWRGMARSKRRLEWRPVACQKPEPSDRLVRRKGRDDCHDCHFCVPRVALQGAVGSGALEKEHRRMCYSKVEIESSKLCFQLNPGSCFRRSCFRDWNSTQMHRETFSLTMLLKELELLMTCHITAVSHDTVSLFTWCWMLTTFWRLISSHFTPPLSLCLSPSFRLSAMMWGWSLCLISAILITTRITWTEQIIGRSLANSSGALKPFIPLAQEWGLLSYLL